MTTAGNIFKTVCVDVFSYNLFGLCSSSKSKFSVLDNNLLLIQWIEDPWNFVACTDFL